MKTKARHFAHSRVRPCEKSPSTGEATSLRAEAATNMNEETNNKNSVMICRHTDKAVVASFKEKLIYDETTVEAVEATMRSLLAKKPGNMVINFADVDFMVTRVINILLMALSRSTTT